MAEQKTKRYFSLWVPSWPVASSWLELGHKPDTPTVIFDRGDNKAKVIATCPLGYREGIRRGMRQRSAQAITPRAHFVISDPVIETKTFEQILEITREMVPRVSLVRPGRLEFDGVGPTNYFGGEYNAAAELIGRVNNIGVDDVFIGIGDTRFSSYVAARLAPYNNTDSIYIVESGKESTKSFLNSQPLSLLDAPEIVDLLNKVGLSTLGDIASISASDMLARFGEQGAQVHALVTGYEDERDTRNLSTPSELLFEEYVSDEPLTSSTQAAFVAKQLSHSLSERLYDQALACSELEIETHLSNGETCTRIWRVESSSFEQVIASRVLIQCDQWLKMKGREVIETTYADEHIYSESFPRGINKIKITATGTMPSHRRQISLFGADPARDADALTSIERIKSIIGNESVCLLEAVGGRMPSEAIKYVEYTKTLEDLTASTYKDSLFNLEENNLSCNLYWPGAIIGRTPMIQYDKPVAARLLDGNNLPIRIHATGLANADPKFLESSLLHGRAEISNFAGPWPLEDRWWDEEKHRRICRYQIVCENKAYLVTTSGESANIIAQY